MSDRAGLPASYDGDISREPIHVDMEDLGDATYVYITVPGRLGGIAETQIAGRTYRLYVNAAAVMPGTEGREGSGDE